MLSAMGVLLLIGFSIILFLSFWKFPSDQFTHKYEKERKLRFQADTISANFASFITMEIIITVIEIITRKWGMLA